MGGSSNFKTTHPGAKKKEAQDTFSRYDKNAGPARHHNTPARGCSLDKRGRSKPKTRLLNGKPMFFRSTPNCLSSALGQQCATSAYPRRASARFALCNHYPTLTLTWLTHFYCLLFATGATIKAARRRRPIPPARTFVLFFTPPPRPSWISAVTPLAIGRQHGHPPFPRHVLYATTTTLERQSTPTSPPRPRDCRPFPTLPRGVSARGSPDVGLPPPARLRPANGGRDMP